MDSQAARPHGHGNVEDPHSAGLHSGVEGDHEKRSVLTKVKDKAKKMKDAFKNRHDHEAVVDDHNESEEDEETVNFHDAPGQDVNLGQPKVNLEKPTVLKDNRYDSKITEPPTKPVGAQLNRPLTEKEGVHVPAGDKHVPFPDETYGTRPSTTGTTGDPVYGRGTNLGEDSDAPRGQREATSNYQTKVSDPTGKDVNLGQPKVNFEKPTVVKEDRYDCKITGPPNTPVGAQLDRPLTEEGVRVPGDRHASFPDETSGATGDLVYGRGTNLEEDSDARRGHRGEAAGITPLLHSFNKMNVHDESPPKPGPETEQDVYGGSHDQFSPESIPTSTTPTPENTELSPKRFDATEPENLPRDTSSSYTSTIGNTAISAKNVIASKLGYGNKEDTGPPEMHEKGDTGKLASAGESGHKITSPKRFDDTEPENLPRGTSSGYTSTIGNTAISAKNVITSKLGYGNKEDTVTPEMQEKGDTGKPASPGEYGHKVTSPKRFDATESENLPRDTSSGYTSTMTNTAISAKNVIASTLGYGNKEDSGTPEMHEKGDTGKPASAGESGHKITSPKRFDATEPENLPRDTSSGYTSTMTNTAISAKNVIASKLGYGNKEDTVTPEMQEKGDTGKPASPGEFGHKITSPVGTGSSEHGTGEKGADKGVSSVKGYMAEKFRPGEEDRALSEVISGALHKRNDEPDEAGKGRPMGKVTESEEVARQLGTGNEDTKNDKGDGVSGNVSPSMVERIKGAVGTWFVKPSDDASEGVAQGHDDGGDQRPKESGN